MTSRLKNGSCKLHDKNKTELRYQSQTRIAITIRLWAFFQQARKLSSANLNRWKLINLTYAKRKF